MTYKFWDLDNHEYLPFKPTNYILVFRGSDEFYYETYNIGKDKRLGIIYRAEEFLNDDTHDMLLKYRLEGFETDDVSIAYIVLPPSAYDTGMEIRDGYKQRQLNSDDCIRVNMPNIEKEIEKDVQQKKNPDA